MSLSKDKSPLSTVVSVELKERLQRIATAKKWTLSHTVKLFIESFIDTWEKELGLGIDSDLSPRAQRTKTKNPTPAVASAKTKRGKGTAQQQGDSER